VEKVEQVDNNCDEQRQKIKVSSDVKVDDVLEQPMRKKIVLSREFTVKRKNRPGKARKPVRAPKLHKSSSSYEDETDPSNDDDGKLFSGRIVQKPTIAAAVVEALDDDDDDDDNCADKKEAGDANEEMTMQLQQAMKRLLCNAQRNKGDFMTRMWRMRTGTIVQG
jgi:hypothetical protein